jgi:hypothetical protein
MTALRFVVDVWRPLKEGFAGLFNFAVEEPLAALLLAFGAGLPLLIIGLALESLK